MADSMGEMGQRASEHAETMRDDTSRMKEDARTTAEHAREAARDMTGRARETARGVKDRAMEYGRQGYDYASEQGRVVRDRTEQYIHENPWYAVGIALGAGILLGMVLRSSSRSHHD